MARSSILVGSSAKRRYSRHRENFGLKGPDLDLEVRLLFNVALKALATATGSL